MPEISIIVPVYKAEKYLRRCVDSILVQTFTDFELLLIDDGSPDNSGVICDEYAVKDRRIRVFHKKNGGVSSARNVGLNNALGKYIMFCDSDDYVVFNWVERLHTLMSSHNADIAMCGIQLVDNTGRNISMRKLDCEENDNIFLFPINRLYELIHSGMLAVVWNKIWKKSIIDALNIKFYEDIPCNEDAIFFLQYMQNCSAGILVDNICTYNYVQGIAGSLSVKYHPHYWDIKKVYFTQLRLALEHCVENNHTYESAFYTDMITGIAATINKILSDSNPHGFVSKLKESAAILHSADCKTAFSKGEFVGFHPLYRFILKTRSFLLVYLFHWMLKIKHN